MITEELSAKYAEHLTNKHGLREYRQNDRTREANEAILCFDLQNVISCPKADISSFFYKRKLNVYNLTAHHTKTKQGFCAVWNEVHSGRSGNDIASAVIKVLEKVVEADPGVKHITTWSDSCVPQNKNSVMSFAIFDFLRHFPSVESMIMKFSVPGHSCVQEVDNMHSQTENHTRASEFFSPLSLMRILKGVHRRKPYGIIQMKESDFKDYQSCASLFQYKQCTFF